MANATRPTCRQYRAHIAHHSSVNKSTAQRSTRHDTCSFLNAALRSFPCQHVSGSSSWHPACISYRTISSDKWDSRPAPLPRTHATHTRQEEERQVHPGRRLLVKWSRQTGQPPVARNMPSDDDIRYASMPARTTFKQPPWPANKEDGNNSSFHTSTNEHKLPPVPSTQKERLTTDGSWPNNHPLPCFSTPE